MKCIVGVMPTNALILFEDNAHNVAASMHPPQTIFLPNIGSFAILHPRLDLIILHCAILIFQSLYFHINFTRKIYISIYSYFLLCYLMDGLHHSRMGVQAIGPDPEAKPETRVLSILNYNRLCPLVPLFGNKCEICLSVTNV